MNWFPKQSAWDEMEAARLKRKEMISSFQSQSQALVAGFQAAANIQIQGIGELAAQSAQSRLQAELDARRKELEERYAKFDKLF
ncbi:hypothetical protein [Pelagibacterium xiamenense]|uniref:hypothetical protein n=1 Tax=Pelagibacterium xiamenense TaxID=2901140 RepID=UPI001E5F0317|nr:hypothetical protein [Pelagibacterium xiamenense]MCD7060332.1 hypothetical protein [Pelagibacterium xiamenense]